MVLEC